MLRRSRVPAAPFPSLPPGLEEVCGILARGLIRLGAQPKKSSEVCSGQGRKSARLRPQPKRSCKPVSQEKRMTAARQSTGNGNTIPILPSVLAQIAALKTASTADLKQQWRQLFGTEPPPFNRAYLHTRLAYRIQELAFGGLKPESVARLQALGERLDGGEPQVRRVRQRDRPIAGTQLVREYEGVQHVVTVLADGFEWEGRPYRSLSAIARTITGTRWNGLVFFGLKNSRSGV